MPGDEDDDLSVEGFTAVLEDSVGSSVVPGVVDIVISVNSGGRSMVVGKLNIDIVISVDSNGVGI